MTQARAVASLNDSHGRVREKMLRPYETCCALAEADRTRPLKIDRGRRRHLRTIAALAPSWGKRLDDLGASYREIRWVAAPDPAERSVEVEYRYRALVRLLEGKGAHRTFRELCDAFPSYDPRSGAELPPIASAET